MNKNNRIVIVGATSAIAEQCARIWIEESEPKEIVLVGRDHQKLEMVADDLRVRSPNTSVRACVVDFLNPFEIQQLAVDLNSSNSIDTVLIAHGSLPTQTDCQQNLSLCFDALEINGISPVLFAEAFVKYMESTGYGKLAIIGSVAGDRGRKSNYVYGAAKGLVERYVQGLQHRLARTDVKVILIKPGPTDTPMTSHLKQDGANLASVELVGRCIVKGIAKGCAVIYAPPKWALIMTVIRNLPNFLFWRMNI